VRTFLYLLAFLACICIAPIGWGDMYWREAHGAVDRMEEQARLLTGNANERPASGGNPDDEWGGSRPFSMTRCRGCPPPVSLTRLRRFTSDACHEAHTANGRFAASAEAAAHEKPWRR